MQSLTPFKHDKITSSFEIRLDIYIYSGMSREKFKTFTFDSLKIKLVYSKKSSLALHILLFIVLVFDESIITFFIGLSLSILR